MVVPLVIDAHQHFWWDPSPADDPWMTDELAVLRRSFGPDDLRPLLAECGVGRTILVQTRSSLEETRQFLGIAARTDFVAGVVGWVNLTHADVALMLETLRSSRAGPWLVGIRHQVHDEPDPCWLLRADVRRGLEAIESTGLTYDLLVRARELPACVQIAREFPGLRLVVDHLAKPPIRTGEFGAWEDAIAPLSECRNVSCNLSGMITEADWHAWQPDDLAYCVRRVAAWFGEDRLMFGSDWPVCLLAGSYAQVLTALLYALGDLSPEARAKILGANASRIYQLPASDPQQTRS